MGWVVCDCNYFYQLKTSEAKTSGKLFILYYFQKKKMGLAKLSSNFTGQSRVFFFFLLTWVPQSIFYTELFRSLVCFSARLRNSRGPICFLALIN